MASQGVTLGRRRQLAPFLERISNLDILPQNFNLDSWLTILTNCLKWRFVQKRGRVADASESQGDSEGARAADE
jgi:hypothetical protein